MKVFSNKKTGVVVKNLSSEMWESYEDMWELLEDSLKLKVVSSTSMNKTSSRSHTIFTMYYKEKVVVNGKNQITDSLITIADLAGFERLDSTDNSEGMK